MTEATGWQRVLKLLNDIPDLALLSLFILAGVIAFLPGIQNRWTYAGAAFVLGMGAGLAVRYMPGIPAGFDFLACILGVIAGPFTAARWHGKTLPEVWREITRARDEG